MVLTEFFYLHIGGTNQCTLEIVSPTVVGAGKPFDVAASLAEQVAPMLANTRPAITPIISGIEYC